MDTGTNDVLFERRGPVAWVTFNRPESRNAMTFAMYDTLARICDQVEADPEVRVLVLTGAGDRAFVAGTDISQFRTFTDPQHALDYETRVSAVVGRLETLARPTIAAVRGYAVGGGASIALACDLRICAPNARFGVPIARTLGNCLSMSNYARLVDLIGPARTKELIFTARMIDAEEAKAMGLANEIVPSEGLEARVMEVAELIASHAPLTIQVTKEAVRRILDYRRPERDEELILRCYMSEDFKEGVDAFLEKRKPRWKGQ
ncbi:MAG: enoyl-CoA hydratase/isomerase family protein [Thermomicrobiaceae bacterium]|nr:enoyl-CoA hydratase/isomerase family protein [Thermomicrobiaceae bacterium]